MRVVNCNIRGIANWGYLAASNPIENSLNLNIAVENCNISGTTGIGDNGVTGAGVLLYAETQEVIQNCKIQDNPIGVYLTANSSFNAILQNTITANDVGIQIDAGSNFNLIKENNIFNNGTNLIDNGTGTQLVNNTIF